MSDLLERLRPSREFGPVCPFCMCDPYHYVDNGVCMERVAVNCCDLGIGYFKDGDEQLVGIVERMTEAADRIERLETALREIMALDGEINPSNYDHDDACYLNTQFVYAFTIAKAALEQPANVQTS